MRIKLVSGIGVLALGATLAAVAADVTGKWKSEFESPVGQLKYVYDLKADGETLTGKAFRTVDGETTETDLKEGKVSSNSVSFVEMLAFNDQELRIEYQGELAGDEIKFTRKVGDFATMQIVAKREGAEPAGKITLKVVKVDSEETAGEDGKGANAVDGNENTFWHTEWQDANPPHPHEIVIELSRAASIKGFTYLPRQSDEVNGTIKDYEFYVSEDGKEFGAAVKKGTFADGKQRQTITFDPRKGGFVKLKALSEINGQPWTSAAEIGVLTE